MWLSLVCVINGLILATLRQGRRRLLNEDEMVEVVADLIPADRIDFDGMTFKEQVLGMIFHLFSFDQRKL